LKNDSLDFLEDINKNIEQIEKKNIIKKNFGITNNKVASKSSIVQQSQIRQTAVRGRR